MASLNKYSKPELVRIIRCYDQYVQDWLDADEDLRAGQEPVSVHEFIDQEYQDMLEAGFENYNEYLDFMDEHVDDDEHM